MSRAKGLEAPAWVAAYLRSWFPSAFKTPNSRKGRDIENTPGIAFEVKTVMEWSPKALKQAAGTLRRGSWPSWSTSRLSAARPRLPMPWWSCPCTPSCPWPSLPDTHPSQGPAPWGAFARQPTRPPLALNWRSDAQRQTPTAPHALQGHTHADPGWRLTSLPGSTGTLMAWEYEPTCFAGPDGQWLPDFRVASGGTVGYVG